MTLRCFVASRIGAGDVDRVWTRLIKPTVARAVPGRRITVVRVDAVHDNAPIDDKIMREMDCADLCVADLTYARPSVYFEAGYMRGRGRPVILTVRRDHLSPRTIESESDDAQRVHFDLAQESIIAWSGPGDRKFEKALGARVRRVLRPRLSELKRLEADKTACESFRALSVTEQQRLVATAAVNLARRAGWSAARSEAAMVNPDAVGPGGARFHQVLRIGNASGVAAMSLSVAESPNLRGLKQCRTLADLLPLAFIARGDTVRVAAVVQFALRDVPVARLRSAFPTASPIDRGALRGMRWTETISADRSEQVVNLYLVVPRVRSVDRAREAAREALAVIEEIRAE